MPSVTAWRTTGKTRANSSSSGNGSAPGRLDSPPMSRICAPSASSCSQCRKAAAVDACWPPSENESGVTFTMPMTRGSPRSIRKRDVRHCGAPEPIVIRAVALAAPRRVQAAVGAGSGATGGGPPVPLPVAGVRGVQSFGGRGSLPARMSSIWSLSMVSHSSRALAMA